MRYVYRIGWATALWVAAGNAAAQGDSAAPSTITLGTMIAQGGVILWVLMALSVATVGVAVYFLLTVTVAREVPRAFGDRIRALLRDGSYKDAYELCAGRDELFVKVVQAGLKAAKHDRYIIQEAMESEGERGATALWQKVSYLNNVAVISTLLGLLGTVWGMIRAFGSIALDNSQVKGLRMAEAVAQAMITTAGGLMLAIVAFVFYFYLHGQVVKITAAVEAQATDMIELIEEGGES